MRSFIAGTSSTRASVASRIAASRSSARPCAARAQKSAVAGATTIASRGARELDVIERVPLRRSAPCAPGGPVSASNVSGAMNSVAARVITTSTAAPSCESRRASHADL